MAVAPSARGSTRIGSNAIVVEAPGARAVIARSPFRLAIQDGRRRTVLRHVSAAGARSLTVPDTSQVLFNRHTQAPATLYAPFAFLVGKHDIEQQLGGTWTGNLAEVRQGGMKYSARAVIAAVRYGGGVRLTVSTTDPAGRRLVVTVRPGPRRGAIRVSARVTPTVGVVAMSDSFRSPSREAFRGFGGRHNSLDQRGGAFYTWVSQQNVSTGTPEGLTPVTPVSVGRPYLWPNGPHAAYSPQSSFISSAGYGFLLTRDELSHWRMGSDRPGAWQTEVAAPAIDYVVAPGGGPRAVGAVTAIAGRHRVPPGWAVGPAFDREVLFPTPGPADYEADVRQDLRDISRYRLPLDAYRIEGWQFLPRPVLREIIATLRARGIHPLVYFRAFVGLDEIGTDDPGAYREALANGYVATRSDGSPYVFTSNFATSGAVIDFTDPAAVRWWGRRIRAALDLGADGFMQDFGEQVQTDMHFHNGKTGATMHNRLPVLFDRATRRVVNAYERDHPKRRIFFYTRSGYSGTPGSNAYASANFPGDETTDWSRGSGIASLATDMLNRGVGGAFGLQVDIGGYWDIPPQKTTTKELFLRWAEWAALSPLYRVHGAITRIHPPWSFDAETVRLYNAYSRLHIRARPLILKLWRRAVRTGIPIARPLWLHHPRDRRAARQDQEWLLGPDVLVAPVVVEGARSRSVYFPRGCWRRAGRGRRYRGGRAATVSAPLGSLPYFFRCGTRPF